MVALAITPTYLSTSTLVVTGFLLRDALGHGAGFLDRELVSFCGMNWK
jgi:hypothetical protein